MSFERGQRLDDFEILAPLGRGGMGEVYRARDLRLDRQVALKALPAEVASDPDRRARFEREAKTLAILNHPNVAAVYEFSAAPPHPYLIMELVEGPALSELLREGALPPGEVLELFAQLAAGLEAAHDRGVIHRDLKPANIKRALDGRAKLLDFGLAKALVTPAFAGDESYTPQPQDETRVMSTPPEPISGAHMVIGTPAYMSPEQARGHAVDKRTDIWAFGCCLFEALTGRGPFQRPTHADTVAAVLEREPDWNALPKNLPPAVLDLLRRCLEKDPDSRLPEIGQARGVLKVASLGVPISAAPKKRTLVLATVILILLVTGGWFLANRGVARTPRTGEVSLAPSTDNRPVRRFTISLDPSVPFAEFQAAATPIALSPNGNLLVYSGYIDGTRQLVAQPMDSLQPTLIPGTEDGDRPFFSPDGAWLAYTSTTPMKIMKMPVSGGAPTPLADIRFSFPAAWGDDGYVYYTPTYRAGIYRVSENGGEPEVVSTLNETNGERGHSFPVPLPGGKGLVYTSYDAPTIESVRMVVQDLETGESRVLLEKSVALRYIPTGHLIVTQLGKIVAVPFDPDTLQTTGAPFDVTEDRMTEFESANTLYTIGGDGTLVYVPSDTDKMVARQPVWIDDTGGEEILDAPPRPYVQLQISPDGGRIACAMNLANNLDIWTYDIGRKVLSRQTTAQSSDYMPLWHPDGHTLFFSSNLHGDWEILRLDTDRSSEPAVVVAGAYIPEAITPDGNTLIVSHRPHEEPENVDILQLELTGSATIQPLLTGRNQQRNPCISPDGRWIAYAEGAPAQLEVFIEAYPELGQKRQVSVAGGREPRWSPDGRTLYYRTRNQLYTVPIAYEPQLTPGVPQLIAEKPMYLEWGASYDVDPAGGRVLVIQQGYEGGPPADRHELIVVQNWLSEIQQLDPRNDG